MKYFKKILFLLLGVLILGSLMFLNLQPDDSKWSVFGPWVYWILVGLFALAVVIRLWRGKDPDKIHHVVGPVASAGQTYASLVMGSANEGASTAFTENSLAALTPTTELCVDNDPPEKFRFT